MGAAELARLISGGDSPEQVAELRRVLHRDRRFTRVAADEYELAEWGGAVMSATPDPDGSFELAPGSDRRGAACTSIDGRWWVLVPVDAEILRGACQGAPAGLVDVVLVAPHVRRTFASRYGPVTVTDEGTEPELGSLRHVALACGAQPGDELWLGFDPAGDVSVRLRSGGGGGDDARAAGDDETSGARAPLFAHLPIPTTSPPRRSPKEPDEPRS
jgi:hypothetical protein